MYAQDSPEAHSRQWGKHPTACFFLSGNASNGHRCYDLIKATIITITALLGSIHLSSPTWRFSCKSLYHFTWRSSRRVSP
jgi:hypothetical protein